MVALYTVFFEMQGGLGLLSGGCSYIEGVGVGYWINLQYRVRIRGRMSITQRKRTRDSSNRQGGSR